MAYRVSITDFGADAAAIGDWDSQEHIWIFDALGQVPTHGAAFLSRRRSMQQVRFDPCGFQRLAQRGGLLDPGGQCQDPLATADCCGDIVSDLLIAHRLASELVVGKIHGLASAATDRTAGQQAHAAVAADAALTALSKLGTAMPGLTSLVEALTKTIW